MGHDDEFGRRGYDQRPLEIVHRLDRRQFDRIEAALLALVAALSTDQQAVDRAAGVLKTASDKLKAEIEKLTVPAPPPAPEPPAPTS